MREAGELKTIILPRYLVKILRGQSPRPRIRQVYSATELTWKEGKGYKHQKFATSESNTNMALMCLLLRSLTQSSTS